MSTARIAFSGVCLLILFAVFAAAQQAGPASAPAGGAAASAATNKYFEFARQRIRFERYCFYGTAFPGCDFDDPAAVKNLIGPYTIAVTCYDSAGQKASTAEKPGRYAAVVEIKRSAGLPSRRFATLCRLGGDGPPETPGRFLDPAVLEAAGVDKQVFADYANDPMAMRMAGRVSSRPGATTTPTASMRAAMQAQRDMFAAQMAANLFDLTALKQAGKPLPKDTLTHLERQWWVTFKRGFYGYDKLYPNAFVCPKPLEGKPATLVHEGTPAEAGMKSDAAGNIDAACQAWLKETRVGFNLVVLRHGVIVFNKAYGTQAVGPNKDVPFTTTTSAPTASGAKFFCGILMGELVDQGLVNLDDSADKYVIPMQGIQVKRPLTVRDCYLHISGLAEIAGDMNPDLEEIVADQYPGAEVAVNHRYGAISLALGGKIMENITGESIPRLYARHLIDPLGLEITGTDSTSGGAQTTAMDQAIIGQMMVNGGAYGDKRFLRPETIQKMMPISGHDRWPPDLDTRWGIGVKQIDSDGLSDQAYGHPGASGTCLVVDPKYDLVISMTRFEEGPMSFKEFLQRKAKVYKAVLEGIEPGK
jgi:CubicO group peptidase (beta-lactamase class C family)